MANDRASQTTTALDQEGTMTGTPREVLERLRKLMAHEQSCRSIGSIHEAQAFAEKIQAIMDEYKLGESDVAFEERQQTEPIGWQWCGQTDPDFPYRDSRRMWQVRLAQALAYVNTCHCVLANKGGNGVAFVGRTSEREYCKAFFIYLLRLADDLVETCARQDEGQIKFDYIHSLQPWQDWDVNQFRKTMRLWKDSWYEGFSQAVCLRLYDRYAEMKRGRRTRTTDWR
ncbi:Uncharacterised protein [uncultured archaeon]|nr:Uncharacterised protein [uncultured archaeon]